MLRRAKKLAPALGKKMGDDLLGFLFQPRLFGYETTMGHGVLKYDFKQVVQCIFCFVIIIKICYVLQKNCVCLNATKS